MSERYQSVFYFFLKKKVFCRRAPEVLISELLFMILWRVPIGDNGINRIHGRNV